MSEGQATAQVRIAGCRLLGADDEPVPEHVAVADDAEGGDLRFRRWLARPAAARFPAAHALEVGVLGALQRRDRRVDHGNAQGEPVILRSYELYREFVAE